MPATKVESQGEGRRSASGGRNCSCLELGGLDDDGGNRSGGGGREPPPSHDGNIHATSHARHRTEQSRVLVDS